MSQFNKYLEIVQEGKDYNYNEGLFGNLFSEKIKSAKDGGRNGLDVKFPSLNSLSNEKDVKKIKDIYPLNNDMNVFIIGLLQKGVVPVSYYYTGGSAIVFTIEKNSSEAEKIIKKINEVKKEDIIDEIIVKEKGKRAGQKSSITYNLEDYEQKLKDKKQQKQKELEEQEEKWNHIPK